MWPFSKKKFPPLESLPVEDVWSVAQGQKEGKPMIVRRNTSAKKYARHPELSYRLGVAIPLRAPDERGYPNKEEFKELDAIEDRLCAALSPAGRLVLVITVGGMKEFVSYVHSAEAAKQAIEKLQRATKSHDVQYYLAHDPKWLVYAELAF